MLSLLTLKIKMSVVLPNGYLGVAENCNLRHSSYGKTIGKSGEQRRGTPFIEVREELGGLF